MSTLKVNALQDTSGNNLSRVLQIVQIVKTDVTSASVSAGSFGTTDSTFNISITPSSSSSLILLGGFVTLAVSGGNQGVKMTLRRDGSTISTAVNGSGTATPIGDASGSRTQATTSGVNEGHGGHSIPIQILDKPNTTSAVTYSLGIGHASSITRTMYINQVNSETNAAQWSRLASVLIAQEIAA